MKEAREGTSRHKQTQGSRPFHELVFLSQIYFAPGKFPKITVPPVAWSGQYQAEKSSSNTITKCIIPKKS